jgi:N-ethylmaleimide reductase
MLIAQDVPGHAAWSLPTLGGIDPQTAQTLIGNGSIDAVSFGRLWMANPDLPERIRADGPYHKAITKRFYGGGPDGYNDYPTLAEEKSLA